MVTKKLKMVGNISPLSMSMFLISHFKILKNKEKLFFSDIGYPKYPKLYKFTIRIRIRKTGYPKFGYPKIRISEISDNFGSDFRIFGSDISDADIFEHPYSQWGRVSDSS